MAGDYKGHTFTTETKTRVVLSKMHSAIDAAIERREKAAAGRVQ